MTSKRFSCLIILGAILVCLVGNAASLRRAQLSGPLGQPEHETWRKINRCPCEAGNPVTQEAILCTFNGTMFESQCVSASDFDNLALRGQNLRVQAGLHGLDCQCRRDPHQQSSQVYAVAFPPPAMRQCQCNSHESIAKETVFCALRHPTKDHSLQTLNLFPDAQTQTQQTLRAQTNSNETPRIVTRTDQTQAHETPRTQSGEARKSRGVTRTDTQKTGEKQEDVSWFGPVCRNVVPVTFRWSNQLMFLAGLHGFDCECNYNTTLLEHLSDSDTVLENIKIVRKRKYVWMKVSKKKAAQLSNRQTESENTRRQQENSQIDQKNENTQPNNQNTTIPPTTTDLDARPQFATTRTAKWSKVSKSKIKELIKRLKAQERQQKNQKNQNNQQKHVSPTTVTTTDTHSHTHTTPRYVPLQVLTMITEHLGRPAKAPDQPNDKQESE